MVLGPAAPEHEPPQRYDVGDEVDVAVDGSSTNPPYDKGWARGVVAFKVCNVDDEHVKAVLPKKYLRDLPPHMGFAYLVKLHDDKGYAPSHHDDPDFIRATDKKYAHDAPTRFAVGDQVECQVGPDVWHRGTVRERRVPYPGYGRGWTEDGEENKKHAGPKDTVAYNVTPHGVTYDSDDEMSSIMVPADKDCFVRAWDGDEADDSSAGEQANPPVTAAQHETLREAFSGLGSNQIDIPHGGGGGDKESLELARYCAGEMKREAELRRDGFEKV